MVSPRIKVTAGCTRSASRSSSCRARTERLAAGAARQSRGAQSRERHAAAANRQHRGAVQRHRASATIRCASGCSSARRRRSRRRRPAPSASCARSPAVPSVVRRRRPTSTAPMAFYQQARGGGGDFNAGIRAGLARILSSPSFLFRSEADPASLAGRGGAPHHRSRARQPPVVLPLEQHPGRRTAESGDRPTGCVAPACWTRR